MEWGGWQGLWGFLTPRAPSASVVAWKLVPRAGAEAGSKLCFYPDTLAPHSIGSSGLGQVVRSSQAGRGTNVLNISNPKTRGLPRLRLQAPSLQGGAKATQQEGRGPGTPPGISGVGIPSPFRANSFWSNKTCRSLHSLVPTPYRSKHLLQPRPHPEGKRHTAWNPLKQESKPCAPTHVYACTHV